MPIVQIEIILRPNEVVRKDLAAELAGELGKIFHSAKGETWVKVQWLLPEQYAENDEPQGSIFPVFVSILKSTLPPPDKIQQEVDKLTHATAQICGRPTENVHVMYEPEGKGRVSFGGKMVR